MGPLKGFSALMVYHYQVLDLEIHFCFHVKVVLFSKRAKETEWPTICLSTNHPLYSMKVYISSLLSSFRSLCWVMLFTLLEKIIFKSDNFPNFASIFTYFQHRLRDGNLPFHRRQQLFGEHMFFQWAPQPLFKGKKIISFKLIQKMWKLYES